MSLLFTRGFVGLKAGVMAIALPRRELSHDDQEASVQGFGHVTDEPGAAPLRPVRRSLSFAL
jgi:hypothetical protein